jgi:hypothetical protein
MWIEIPASVERIEESSFDGCRELENCLIAEDSSVVTIGMQAFAKCASLRSFDISSLVREIGINCLDQCIHLYRLKFQSSQSLKRVIGDRSLGDRLHSVGVSANSSLFGIEVKDSGEELKSCEWSANSVRGGDGDLHLVLVRDYQ